MKITTYYSDEAGQFLAHMDFGNDTYMSFFGPTAKAAHKRATDWYEAEKTKQSKIAGTSEANFVKYPVKKDEITNYLHGKGRGHHFAGKVWMIHGATRVKVRIDQSEVASYEANGYVRGGPRSK